MADRLKAYRAKRDFSVTGEPAGGGEAGSAFVIQKHWARRLHYDLRLELDGVMKSWAVPKGPSYDPRDKRMAVQVEDHPIAYNQFEGDIPAGQYGAGKVIIWDEGAWTPLQDPKQGLRDGMLKFSLDGRKMHGHWALVRMRGKREKQPAWLLIKERDDYARPARQFSVVDEMPDSVVPLRGKSRRAAGKAGASRTGGGKAAGKKAAGGETPAARLPGVEAALPAKLEPQLATLVSGLPAGAEADAWRYELKFDGYRLLARIDGAKIRLITRNGKDWTTKFPHLVEALGRLALPSGWLDGEIVVLVDDRPHFQALQDALGSGYTDRILYYLFDAPYLAGRDLRREPLDLRRSLLKQLLGKRPPRGLRYSDTFEVPPGDLVASACKLGFEGVIGKRRDAPYTSGRSPAWIKLRCGSRQEFVVVGYTQPKGARVGLGALMLAVHDDRGQLRYAGNVGTGFDDKTLAELERKLRALAVAASPLPHRTDQDRRARWVRPVLVAEVSFGSWTKGGRIRHSVFRGLRQDKPADAIVQEKATKASPATMTKAKTRTETQTKTRTETKTPQAQTPKLRVTHPDRVIDPSTGTTKLDLVRYYALVAPLLLPHLKGRPTALVRAPDGIAGELFFQKHMETAIAGVKLLDPALDPGHPPLLEIPNAQALVSAAQMNVIEFHTWNAVKTAISRPDRMTFDLDPGEGVAWKTMQQAASLVRTLLQELGLASYLKTTGGKGLHVVVPLRRSYDWDTVKGFSRALVEHLAGTVPQLFVAKSGPRNRVRKIFADYLRNGYGATTVSAWSARARPGMGVSVPVRWDELEALRGPAQWTVANIHTRLDQGNAPWEGYAGQSLGAAMKRLGFEPPGH